LSSNGVAIFKNFTAPQVVGTHYRLLCMTGPNKGLSYFMSADRIVMGRDKGCEIVVLDAKSSREHAELKKIGDEYIISDLGSNNGLVVGNRKITQKQLSDGDSIVIGKTVYKYSIVLVGATDGLVDGENGERPDLDSNEDSPADGKKKSRLFVMLFLVVLLGMFLFDDSDSGRKKSKKSLAPKNITTEFANIIRKKIQEEDREIEDKLQVVIHRGLREYREGNYFRSIAEFNLALVLSPNDGRASFYLNKAKQALDEEIEERFLRAKQEADALKYESSIITYCSVVRLLQLYTEDQRYKEALTNIKVIEKRMGKLEGEVKCF
jgi:hypothetical protein